MDLRDTSEQITAVNVALKASVFRDTDLSGSQFEDVNLSDCRFRDVNLSGVDIADANLEGMRINGVLVNELLAAYGGEAK